MHPENTNKHAQLFKYMADFKSLPGLTEKWKDFIKGKYRKAEGAFSLAHFYFKDMFLVKYHRDERYSSTDAICKSLIRDSL